MRGTGGLEIEVEGELGAEESDEVGVHEFVVVGDTEDDQRFIGELGGETRGDGGGVFFLHAENQIGPADVAGGEFHAGAVDGAGGAGVVTRMIAEERFGGGRAPLVARAEEEELGFHRGEGVRIGRGECHGGKGEVPAKRWAVVGGIGGG